MLRTSMELADRLTVMLSDRLLASALMPFTMFLGSSALLTYASHSLQVMKSCFSDLVLASQLVAEWAPRLL